MADARNPPPGPPSRDPTAPARLLDAAAEVGLRVERAKRDLDRLEVAVDRLAGSAGPPTGGPSPGNLAPRRGNPASPIAGGASLPEGQAASVTGDLPLDGDPDAEGEQPVDPSGGSARADADGGHVPGPPPEQPARSLLPAALQTYGSQLVMAVLSLVNALIMARALGATGRGEVVFLTTVAFLGSNVSTLGVQEANVNLAGSDPAARRSLATNSLVLSLLLGAAGGLLIVGLVTLVPAAGAGVSWTLLWVICASLPMLILSTYLRFLIQGTFGFGITNLAWILPSVVNVMVNCSLALFGSLSVAAAVSTWVAGQTISTAVLVIHVVRKLGGFGPFDARLARRTLGFGVKSHFGRIMLIANYRLDQWLLGAIGGTKQLGVYSVAVAFAEGLFLLPTALSAVQRPSIVRAPLRDAVRLTVRVFRASLVITAAMAAVLAALAPVLCVTLFGEEFRDSATDLRVLVTGAFGVVALKQLGNALTGRDRPLAASLSIGSAFVFTIVLDIVLIPEYGDLGAAIASSVAYTFGGLVIALVFVRSLGGRVTDLVPRPSDVAMIAATVRRVLGRGQRGASV